MSKSLKIVRTVKDLRKQVGKWRADGKSVALVPTMGALHDGHLGLVKLAKKKADRVVVSIFVNPTQFAPTEDLSRYPRDEAGDLESSAASAPICSGRHQSKKCIRTAFPQQSSRDRQPKASKAQFARSISAALQPCAANCSRRFHLTSQFSARRIISS